MPLSEPLLDLLDRVDAALPLERKRLLAPSVNYAREALVGLVRRREGVLVGWEGTTLRRLADELAFTALHRAGRRTASDIELATLTSRALDDVLAAGCAAFAPLAESVGFRRAVHDAVLELRIAGVEAAQFDAMPNLRAATIGLRDVLLRYEALLRAARRADPAEVFTHAIAAYTSEAPFALGSCHLVIAGLAEPAGLPARLLSLLTAGPQTVTVWHPPTLDHAALAAVQVVRAAAPEDEMLALFRSVAAAGAPVDSIECVADDRDGYGAALYAAAARLNVDVTSLHGLPMAGTRLGRAVQLALHVLGRTRVDAGQLAAALERRELQAPMPFDAEAGTSEAGVEAALARFVRRHRVGGTTHRLAELRTSLARTESELAPERREDEADDAYAARTAEFGARAQQTVRLLDLLIQLRTAACVGDVLVPPAAIAAALLAWLERLVPALDDEQSARKRLQSRLELLVAAATEPVPAAQAMAEVAAVLEAMRVWPTARRAPYGSGGGATHLTDLRHAGATARLHHWFAGLDADAVRGVVREAPLLDDVTRARLRDAMAMPLPDAAERTRRRRALLEQAVAAAVQRGASVTLSWSAGVDGDVAPDRLILDALRARPEAAAASTKQLLATVKHVSVIPARGEVLDDRDAWLHALLADGPRDGSAAIAQHYPSLARWAAVRAASSDAARSVDDIIGRVPDAAAQVPTRSGRSVSATELAELLTCTRRWFFTRALKLRAPEELPEPAEWLDAAGYGSLVHRVYAQAVQSHVQFDAPDALSRLNAMARDAVDALASREPPESVAARAVVEQRLLDDVAVFLQMERAHAAGGVIASRAAEVWRATPRDGGLVLEGGRRLRLHARLDRADRRQDGQMEVWDFKTGKAFTSNADLHRLTQAFVGAVLAPDAGAMVAASGYRFATERADGAVLAVPAADRARVRAAADQVLAVMEQGVFPPTTLKADSACKYCGVAALCRVSSTDYQTASPMAEWAAARAALASADDPVTAIAAALQGGHGGAADDA